MTRTEGRDEKRILRFPATVTKTGLSRSSIYGRIRAGDFPTPVPLGDGRAVGFVEREIDSWIDAMASRRGGVYGAA